MLHLGLTLYYSKQLEAFSVILAHDKSVIAVLSCVKQIMVSLIGTACLFTKTTAVYNPMEPKISSFMGFEYTNSIRH